MKRLRELSLLLPVLALVSISLAVWGWSRHATELGLTSIDIVYRSLGALSISSFYDRSARWGSDWRIELARMLGAFALFATVTRALTQVLNRQLREHLARFRRGHVIIIGDHPVARAIAEAAARQHAKATWIAGEGVDPDAISGVLIVPRHWRPEFTDAFAASHAVKAVVALDDETAQIAMVRGLRAAAPVIPVFMNVEDPWFADRLDELENIPGVRYVSVASIAVRQLHARNPPFLIARALGQEQLHALVIGYGRTGETAVNDLLLSQLTSFLDRPRVTIVDPRVREIEASLAQRAPELYRSAEIEFIEPEFKHDVRAVPVEALVRANAASPFTLAYVSVDSDIRTMSLAISLRALARRQNWAIGPIYTRLSAAGAFPVLDAATNPATTAALVSWGDTHDFADDLGLFGGDTDRLPRAFHEAYRRAAPGQAVANLPWEALSEEARASNRHLLVHLPAKLESIGIDSGRWLASAFGTASPSFATQCFDLGSDAAWLDQLAALEHARWSTERRLSGWRSGSLRDDPRRIHPGLVDWADLPEPDRAFNRAMVSAMMSAVLAAKLS